MSHNLLEKEMRDAIAISTLNKIRHAFLGRIDLKDAAEEISIFCKAFRVAEDSQGMSALILSNMEPVANRELRESSYISDALSEYLHANYEDATMRNQQYIAIKKSLESLQSNRFQSPLPREESDCITKALENMIDNIASYSLENTDEGNFTKMGL